MFIPPHLNLHKFNQKYYRRFKNIEKFKPILIIKDEIPEPYDSLFIYDIDFVIRNRDFNSFKTVLKRYFPYYFNANFLEMILLIVERKKDFKLYIDYIYHLKLDGFIEDAINDPKTQDLLTWLHLGKKYDAIDYLINHTPYPKKIFEKQNSPDYRFWAISHNVIKDVEFVLDNYEYDQNRMSNAVINMWSKDIEGRIKLIDLFIERGLLDISTKDHADFIFNSKREFKGLSLKKYISHYNVNLSDKKLHDLIHTEQDHITHLLNNNFNCNLLTKNGFAEFIINNNDVYVKSLLHLFERKEMKFLYFLGKNKIILDNFNKNDFISIINSVNHKKEYQDIHHLKNFILLTKTLGFNDYAINYIKSINNASNRYDDMLSILFSLYEKDILNLNMYKNNSSTSKKRI